MREIKFRAWSNHLKKMFLPDTLARLHFNEGLPYCFYTIEGRMIIHKELILMQYTGRKDKDGKEIYGKDILKYKYGSRTYISEVKWDDDLAGFRPFVEYDSDCSLYIVLNSIEKIGNVYENPDILKGEGWIYANYK